MTHQFAENYQDYALVLQRDDGQPSKDERFIARTFMACGFDDVSTGDELEFKHLDHDITIVCDGDALAVQLPAEPASLEGCYADLLTALGNLEWASATLYCDGDIDETIHSLARYIPGNVDFDVRPGVQPERGVVEDLKHTIAARGEVAPPAPMAEPVVRVSEIALESSRAPAAQADVEDVSAVVDSPAASLAVRAQSEHSAAAKIAPPAVVSSESNGNLRSRESSSPASHSAVVRTKSAPAPHWQDVSSLTGSERDLLIEQLVRANEAYRQQNEELTGLLKQQMLRSVDVERFAAAVVPEDAIAIAHLPRRKAVKLSDLGFAQDYNVLAHEEYGALLDGSYLVFTKDVAPPEWVETLLGRLGGTIGRLWQSGGSVIGTQMEQYVAEDRAGTNVVEVAEEPAVVDKDNVASTGNIVVAESAEPVHHQGDALDVPASPGVPTPDPVAQLGMSGGSVTQEQVRMVEGFMAMMSAMGSAMGRSVPPATQQMAHGMNGTASHAPTA